MPKKCDPISYCSPTPYREPRKQSSKQASWRFAPMHLKPYPKCQKNDLVVDGPRSVRKEQQDVLRTEWGVRQACTRVGLPGNGTVNRCPLSILSSNTLCCGHNTNTNRSSNKNGDVISAPNAVGYFNGSWSHKSEGSTPVQNFTSPPLLLSPASPGLENEGSLKIYQTEDGDGALDTWPVIKPGNTREKIAIFSAQQSGKAGDTVSDRGGMDIRTMGTVKLRGSWDGGCSVAKRRRKVGALDKCRKLESHSPNPESRLAPLEDHLPQVEGEEGAKTVSVAEMVAYLEQIANCHQVNSKPFLLRTSSTATLSKSIVLQLPPADPGSVELPDPGQEEGESVRVLDMVAKLESECLKHQSSRESGELSRNNSLRRNVARVLLAGSEPYHVPARPEPPTVRQEERLEGPSVAGRHGRSDESRSSTLAEPHLPVERMEEGCMAEVECSAMEPGAEEEQQPGLAEEPLPGMLFFTAALPVVSEKHPATHTEVKVHPKMPLAGVPELTSNPWFSTQSEKELLHLASTLGLTERILQQAGGAEEEMVVEERKDCLLGRNLIPFPLRRQVSHEFLETRFKIQMLLEPQQYLAYLPHHIIVKIFSLLPTETLAALKCTCHYFKFIIENYGVRPADSRWVSDPRYRDDPCKQCKKRYGRGDVSLCRWHHKPYCQAMPYGPGYWMCCHGSHKDTPGCNVGLHDNRWVPAFHSISMPIYKNRDAEEAL